MTIITINKQSPSRTNFFQLKGKLYPSYFFIFIFFTIGSVETVFGSDKIYSGFYVGSHNSVPDEQDICSAFVNLKISDTKLVFEMDYFDEKNNRKKHSVTFYVTKNRQKSPYKELLYARNPDYYTVGRPSTRGTFEYWLGEYVQWEYKNNGSEIIGKFGGKNVFYLLRTDKNLKLPKKNDFFVPLNDKKELTNAGFLLVKNKNGFIRECIFSEFDAQHNYSGNTILITLDWIYKGQAKDSKFIESYTLDKWAPCYFTGYDEIVVRWVVVLKQLDNVTPAAYGYNCNNKLASQCDNNFNNCKQLIEKEVDYSLVTALAALAGGTVLAYDAITNSSNSSSSTFGSSSSSYSSNSNGKNSHICYESSSIEQRNNCGYGNELCYEDGMPIYRVKCSNGDLKNYYKSKTGYYYEWISLAPDPLLSDDFEKAMKELCDCKE